MHITREQVGCCKGSQWFRNPTTSNVPFSYMKGTGQAEVVEEMYTLNHADSREGFVCFVMRSAM